MDALTLKSYIVRAISERGSCSTANITDLLSALQLDLPTDLKAVSPKGTEVSVISRQIANAHTMFNAAMTLIWMPLLGVMVRIVTTLVKDGEPKKKEPITDIASLLNYRLLNEPESALLLIQSKVETALDFANITKEKLAAQEIGDEQEFFDEVLFVQREAERLMGYITALIATNNLTNDQAVLCEELIVTIPPLEVGA